MFRSAGVEGLSPLPFGEGKRLNEERVTLPAIEVQNKVVWVNPDVKSNLPFRLEEGKPTNLALFLTPVNRSRDGAARLISSQSLPDQKETMRSEKPGLHTPPKVIRSVRRSPKEKPKGGVNAQGEDAAKDELEVTRDKEEVRDGREAKPQIRQVEIHESHRRSSLLGRVLFSDGEGNIYRDIDIKGNGYSSHNRVQPVGIWTHDEASGISTIQSAYRHKSLEKKLNGFNIRTGKIIAIAELDEIVDAKGNKLSIEDAKQAGILPEGVIPVIEVRAFATKMRVSDLLGWDSSDPKKKRGRLYIDDAKKLVATEFGFDESKFGDREYLYWFARQLGSQVARLHKNGYVHKNLRAQNITLDCRIVDFDSVIQSNTSAERGKDDRWISNTMSRLLSTFPTSPDQLPELVELEKIYQSAYQRELST